MTTALAASGSEYHVASIQAKSAHADGRSSVRRIALFGQAASHAPQSMQVSGLMYSFRSIVRSALMQSTGQTWVHDWSMWSTQGAAWRALHMLTFLAFAGATAHGILAGSDSGATWAWWLPAGSVTIVTFLFAYRIVISVARRRARRTLSSAGGGRPLVASPSAGQAV